MSRDESRPARAAFFATVNTGDAVVAAADAEVFNMFVENSVEKGHSIFVSDSSRDASAFCTGAGAGTFVVRTSGQRLKVRLDKLLVDRGMVASRERAQALILAGKVLVDEQKLEKSGAQVNQGSTIRLLGEDHKYVSRGGLKLQHALDQWKIDVAGKVCFDIGASTGGFTDCLLQRGAAYVVAVDTGYGQMDFKLRQNPRVRLLEKTNARYLTREDVGATPNLIAMDVSFISATLVLPAVIGAAFPESPSQRQGLQIVVLVKPQFEAGREFVAKGGIVRDEGAHRAAVERVRVVLTALGAKHTDAIESPILGAEGNREFLLYGVF